MAGRSQNTFDSRYSQEIREIQMRPMQRHRNSADETNIPKNTGYRVMMVSPVPSEVDIHPSESQVQYPHPEMSFPIYQQPTLSYSKGSNTTKNMQDMALRYIRSTNPETARSPEQGNHSSKLIDQKIDKPTRLSSGSKNSNSFLIFKRVMSISLILADMSMAWVQLIEMNKASGDVVFKGELMNISCKSSFPIILSYIVLMCLDSIFTIIEIINIVGETIYDVKGEQNGFQFMHGFIEINIKMTLKDIPQFLLIFLYIYWGCECILSSDRWVKLSFMFLLAILASYIRKVTCKQEAIPCCGGTCAYPCCCCCSCCNGKFCPDELGCEFPCCFCYCPLCTKKFRTCVPVSICRYMGLCQNGCCGSEERACGCCRCNRKACCTPRLKNPEFAPKMSDKLYFFLLGFLILIVIFMHFKCKQKMSVGGS
ncbi:hypothetical protein ACJMK2_007891 [Sinanodonta woodiana]|uniref:Uncharacterized protein n=1 Tax=Sinanodonta woodiana TaxID=1069815 RepID=A0ABD3VJU3_SINWO